VVFTKGVIVVLPVFAPIVTGATGNHVPDPVALVQVPVHESDVGESQTIRTDLPLYVVTVGPG